ncbi:MAG: DNA gyrase subunit A [Saprospiraceae bacterium]
MSTGERIIPINIEEEMKSAYIDYSMSVIVSRALPDVRDGLKPVHRRVLYGMSGLGLTYNKSHKKSARIVGEVLGKYHPHGDSSVYEAMVRMAQPWSLRYPLVDGQGNFGSVDGDSPAAMRYTEARLQRLSDELLADINKETVDFAFNFDDTLKEPTVLPSKIPNLLINGASGIAVGMATNMLPHNLGEVIDGIHAYIENYDITIDELCEHIKAPDFPTGGIIYGYQGVKEGFETGRGRVVVRGKADIETTNSNKERIIITEIPYQVNKATLIVKIADMVNSKKIEGISDIRDESDRTGMRIVVDIKRDGNASVILSQLYKYSPLQTSYGVNNIALVKGRPVLLNLKDMIREFVAFRIEVIQRRTIYDLRKAKERAHILEGLLIALDHLDQVIALIRKSKTPDEARDGLVSEFELSELQAKAILEMRLQRLTGLELDKIKAEYAELQLKIADLEDILADENRQKNIIKDELTDIKERFGDERKTQIEYSAGEIRIEDMIADDEFVITISNLGYIKRTKSEEYKTQSRGGKGSRGSKTRDADFIEHMFVATAHNYLLFFTEQGRCFWSRVFEIPEASKTSSGRVLQRIIEIPPDDKVKAYIKIQDLNDQEFLENNYIMLCTKNGIVKKTAVKAFSRPRSSGIYAITIREGDQLLEAKLTNGQNNIIIASRSGRAIQFPEAKVRAMGRTAAGVRGIHLKDETDRAVGMICVEPNDETTTVLVISEKGQGKRTALSEYRETNRGGKGVKTMQITEKTGQLFAIKAVEETDNLMITSKEGITIRMSLNNISVLGRATQGVRVIKLGKKDQIADVALIKETDEDENNTGIEDENSNNIGIEDAEIVENNDNNEAESSDEEA